MANNLISELRDITYNINGCKKRKLNNIITQIQKEINNSKWHYLIDDSKDLPKNNKKIVIYKELDGIYKGYDIARYEDKLWINDNDEILVDWKIIKWKYI